MASLYVMSSWPAIHSPSVMEKKNRRIPQIRVKVGDKLEQVYLVGNQVQRINHINGDKKHFKGRKAFSFNCKAEAKNGQGAKRLLLASLLAQGPIKWDEHLFSGQMTLTTSPYRDGCDLINEVSLEDYISTLLAKEMHGSWHIEALKAQAVAARTYAYEKILRGQRDQNSLYDLESSEKDQVSGSLFDITSKTIKAAQISKGEILVSKTDENIYPVFYHSQCGGRTFTPDQVWGQNISGYQNVFCPHCFSSNRGEWSATIKFKDWMKFLDWYFRKMNIKVSKNLANHQMIGDKTYETYLYLKVGPKKYRVKKGYLRKYFGREDLDSNYFQISKDKKGDLSIHGKGLGHGVGMCQLGALYLANKGWDYQKILSYYYPGLVVKKIY